LPDTPGVTVIDELLTEVGSISLLNWIWTGAFTGTPVAPFGGDTNFTIGAVVSGLLEAFVVKSPPPQPML